MKGLKNVNVYVEGKGVIKTSIGFENGLISCLDETCEVEEVAKLSEDMVVVPGFIDQHIHGAKGYDAMDGTYEALYGIASALPKEGTTAFLATTMTQSPENITTALNAVRDYKALNKEEGAFLLGVHLEGPFISTSMIGAQPLEYVANPNVEIFKKYQEESGNSIKVVSLAPEVEGGAELVKYLKEIGVVASLGHTAAGYNDVEKAVAAGATNVTHTYNAQKAYHHRDIGTVGAALLIDELNCELICDTIHVSVPAIKMVVKNKPHNKVTLITDAMRAKQLEDGISELGGQTVIVKNGEARLENGALAGSVLLMNHAIKNVVEKCGVPFTDAIDMATINPACNLGVDKEMGSIALGKKANLTVLDKNYEVILTIREGKVVYQK
ncbi:MAG: N-acetylglucosamine-6-phosphate deacetylase [Bacilli bacterium]|nr:N-acetylglucosamine-6-phosphate deacetylase [Bacilli bacterium]